jgi:hypothetical protein
LHGVVYADAVGMNLIRWGGANMDQMGKNIGNRQRIRRTDSSSGKGFFSEEIRPEISFGYCPEERFGLAVKVGSVVLALAVAVAAWAFLVPFVNMA